MVSDNRSLVFSYSTTKLILLRIASIWKPLCQLLLRIKGKLQGKHTESQPRCTGEFCYISDTVELVRMGKMCQTHEILHTHLIC